jgi:SAM-dependent methyltransferase
MDHDYACDYDDAALAELYDRHETYTDDVELIRRLIGGCGPLNVLECFCGTGRIALPLAQDGHRVTGIDIAAAMLARARAKTDALGPEVGGRVNWKCRDVLSGEWGTGFDLVILGGNAFYELPSAAMQERCIALAAESSSPRGFLYVDNNDFAGTWRLAAQPRVVFEGTTADGSHARYLVEELSFDDHAAILHMKRTVTIRSPYGRERCREYTACKHPVSKAQVHHWIEGNGYEILDIFGDRSGTRYGAGGNRAIFWAQSQARAYLDRMRPSR